MLVPALAQHAEPLQLAAQLAPASRFFCGKR